MLTDRQTIAADTRLRRSLRRRRRMKARSTPITKALAFLAMAGLLLAYAMRGGAYDIVVRQEYGLVIWSILAVGFALRLLPRSRPSRGALAVVGLLVAYAAWTGISLAWTQSAERTTVELARALDYVGLCVLVASLIDRDHWRPAMAGLGAGALIVCCLSVASRLFPSAFPANIVGAVFQTDRLSYPFGYWNAVGAWGAMSIAIGLGWSANDSARWRRAAMLAGVPVAGTMTYLSYSRGAVIGAGLAIVAVLILSRRRWTALAHVALAGFGTAVVIAVIRGHAQIAHASGDAGAGSVLAVLAFACALCAVGSWLLALAHSDSWHLPRGIARPLGVIAAGAVLVAVAVFGPHLASRAWHQFRNPNGPTAGANPTARLVSLSGNRYNLWAVAFHAFEAKPLTGTGAGTYEFDWNRHQRDQEFVLNAHSLWFESLAELGLPGLLAIAGFVLGAAALLVRVRRRVRRSSNVAAATAAAAAFVVFVWSASEDWMWQLTAVSVLALAGVAIAASRFAERPAGLRWAPRLLLAALAAAVAWLQVPGLESTLALRRSQAAERSGNAALALAWARTAIGAEPWAATPYEQKALVLESAHRLRAAAAAEREALADEPTNYTHWLIMARIQAERGDLARAVLDYEHARSLRPLGEVFDLKLMAPGLAAFIQQRPSSGRN